MIVHALGRQWITRDEAADAIGVRTRTIDVWRTRRQVDSYTDRSGTIWVDYAQTLARESRTHQRRRATPKREPVAVAQNTL